MTSSTAPEWRTTSIPPIEPARFGADHWSTFAYLENRAVEHRGTVHHAHMRCHGQRHPALLLAEGSFLSDADGSQYPTRLRGGEELADHDDYDCIDDLIAAGLLEVHMPKISSGHHVGTYFVDAYDRPITDDGELVTPEFLTGLAELHLGAYATFSLTARGVEVASALRAHRVGGGSFATFTAE